VILQQFDIKVLARCKINWNTNMATQNAKLCFRRLIRSAKIAFSNDKHALKAARAQLRVEFLKNKHVTDPVELQVMLL
jgi:hypothetical protein